MLVVCGSTTGQIPLSNSFAKQSVLDQLFDGRRLRARTLVDNYSRECLVIDFCQNLRDDDAVAILACVRAMRGKPRIIKADNGSEFISKTRDKGEYENGVEIDFSRLGTPTDNALRESFNLRLRQECRHNHWFSPFADVKEKVDAERTCYNEICPHSALKWQAPAAYSRQRVADDQRAISNNPGISTSGPCRCKRPVRACSTLGVSTRGSIGRGSAMPKRRLQ